MNAKAISECRNTPTLRHSSKDGSQHPVKTILSRNLPSVCIGIIGIAFIATSLLTDSLTTTETLQAVCGGIFVGVALSGVVER